MAPNSKITQKVIPYPYKTTLRGVVESLEWKPDQDALVFGVMFGSKHLEIMAVTLAGKTLPAIRFELIDDTVVYQWPAVMVPRGLPLVLMMKSSRPIDDGLEFMAWFDQGAPQWMKQQQDLRL